MSENNPDKIFFKEVFRFFIEKKCLSVILFQNNLNFVFHSKTETDSVVNSSSMNLILLLSKHIISVSPSKMQA